MSEPPFKRRAYEVEPTQTESRQINATAGHSDVVAHREEASDDSPEARKARLGKLLQGNAKQTGVYKPPPRPPSSTYATKMLEHAVIVPKRAPQLKNYGKKTGLAYDVRMRYHSHPIANPQTYIDPHPEDPRRTFRIYRAIAEAGLIEDEHLQGSTDLGPLMAKLTSRRARDEELQLVHTQEMIDFIKSTSGMRLTELQDETDKGDSIYLNNDSDEAGRLSAGGAIEACRAVVTGAVKNAIAVIRPPGHHAEPDYPAGFCLFGNVSIASRVMFHEYPETVRKILVYDWDVHHGNGTQRAFWEDDRVLYISTHRYEDGAFYPGTTFGNINQVGAKRGEGYTVNIPWSNGQMGDGDYLTAFDSIIMPIAAEFNPDLVIVSAGFDAAEGDPIGGYHVSPAGYQNMLARLMTLAEGKVVVCLEGGYSLDAISRSALAITKTLLGDPPERPTSSLASKEAITVISKVREIQSKYWESMGPPVIMFEPEIERYQEQQHEQAERAEKAREGSTDEDESDSASPKEEPENDGKVLKSLMEVVRASEREELRQLYGMAQLPILHGSLISELLATPNVFTAEKVAFVFHAPSLIWAHCDPITGRIRPDESVVANPMLKYIQWACRNDFGVVDVFLSPLEKLSAPKLISHICENTLRYFNAEKVVVIGAGQACGAAVQMCAHRDMKDRFKAMLCFVGPEDTPRQFPSTADDKTVADFYEKSLTYISRKHNIWSLKYRPKKLGRVIQANAKNLYAMMCDMFEEATMYLGAEVEDTEDESDSESEGTSQSETDNESESESE